jgi:hypothetical protein
VSVLLHLWSLVGIVYRWIQKWRIHKVLSQILERLDRIEARLPAAPVNVLAAGALYNSPTGRDRAWKQSVRAVDQPARGRLGLQRGRSQHARLRLDGGHAVRGRVAAAQEAKLRARTETGGVSRHGGGY